MAKKDQLHAVFGPATSNLNTGGQSTKELKHSELT